MKRGWLAAGLLVAMTGASLWHAGTMVELTRELREGLARAETMTETGGWQEAAALTREVRERWRSRELYLHVTLDHTTTDQISTSFAEVGEFLEHQEEGEYSAANARLMEQLKLLGEMERPALGNLF